MVKTFVALLALSALFPVTVFAQQPPEPEPTPPPLMRVPSTDPTGKGLAIGYSQGLWGRGMGDSLGIRVPFARQHWCVVARALGAIGQKGTDGVDRALEYGGSIELHGQSDVYLNLMRLYGGGGEEIIHGYRGADRGRTAWTGRYEFGFEFFLGPRMSFNLEIGGNGFGTTLTEGPMIFGGINLYTPLLR